MLKIKDPRHSSSQDDVGHYAQLFPKIQLVRIFFQDDLSSFRSRELEGLPRVEAVVGQGDRL
jgi:hypothetical protein